MKRKGVWIADLRKAYKQPRKNRYCPRCGKRTEVGGDGIARCSCGWFAGCTLALPPVARVIQPVKELRKT